MERKDRKVRKNGASQAEMEAGWRRRCGEEKWRLNVEINSFENDTEMLHREKTWSDAEIQQGYSCYSQGETSVTRPGHTCNIPAAESIPSHAFLHYRCVKCSRESLMSL